MTSSASAAITAVAVPAIPLPFPPFPLPPLPFPPFPFPLPPFHCRRCRSRHRCHSHHCRRCHSHRSHGRHSHSRHYRRSHSRHCRCCCSRFHHCSHSAACSPRSVAATGAAGGLVADSHLAKLFPHPSVGAARRIAEFEQHRNQHDSGTNPRMNAYSTRPWPDVHKRKRRNHLVISDVSRILKVDEGDYCRWDP